MRTCDAPRFVFSLEMYCKMDYVWNVFALSLSLVLDCVILFEYSWTALVNPSMYGMDERELLSLYFQKRGDSGVLRSR